MAVMCSWDRNFIYFYLKFCGFFARKSVLGEASDFSGKGGWLCLLYLVIVETLYLAVNHN